MVSHWRVLTLIFPTQRHSEEALIHGAIGKKCRDQAVKGLQSFAY
jgi:hypothetical protein